MNIPDSSHGWVMANMFSVFQNVSFSMFDKKTSSNKVVAGIVPEKKKKKHFRKQSRHRWYNKTPEDERLEHNSLEAWFRIIFLSKMCKFQPFNQNPGCKLWIQGQICLTLRKFPLPSRRWNWRNSSGRDVRFLISPSCYRLPEESLERYNQTERTMRKRHWIQVNETEILKFYASHLLLMGSEIRLTPVEVGSLPLQETNISPKNGILKIFLFPRWDMLIPWRGIPVIYPGFYRSKRWFSSRRISGAAIIPVSKAAIEAIDSTGKELLRYAMPEVRNWLISTTWMSQEDSNRLVNGL